nr:MAG TPA: hypothetical protein [Caudoviricetes sp.]
MLFSLSAPKYVAPFFWLSAKKGLYTFSGFLKIYVKMLWTQYH